MFSRGPSPRLRTILSCDPFNNREIGTNIIFIYISLRGENLAETTLLISGKPGINPPIYLMRKSQGL